jgi:hypothetical protein
MEFKEGLDSGGTFLNDPKNNSVNNVSNGSAFDVSLVGRARQGFRMPVSGGFHVGGSSAVHVRGTTQVPQKAPTTSGPRMVPPSDRVTSPSLKDTDSAYSFTGDDSRYPEIVRTGYILSFTGVILATCLLESHGNVYALNLAMLSSLPLLSATMVLHSVSQGKIRLALLAMISTTFLSISSISIILADTTLSLLRHLPGLLCLTLFFYGMSTAWRRIMSAVCSVLILLSIVTSAVIDANFQDKQTMVLATCLIFGLLFLESNVAVTPLACKKEEGGCMGIV